MARNSTGRIPHSRPATRRCLAAAVLMAAAHHGSAARLALCDAPAPGATVLERYLEPGGAARVLAVAEDAPRECQHVEIHVAPAQVRWARLITRGEAATFERGISLRGVENAGRLAVSEVFSMTEPPPAPAPLPFSTELLGMLAPTPFGTEERATARRESSAIVVECRGGAQPAGITLGAGRPLPRGAQMELIFEYQADQPFRIGIADGNRARRGDPAWLGTAAPTERSARWRVPAADTDPGGWQAWTVLCPNEPGRIVLRSLRAMPQPATARAPGRALWAWRPAQWLETPATLLQSLEKSRADTVYLTVLVRGDAVQHPRELAEFIGSAAERGIKVWAVNGDPRAVLEPERPAQVALARAYASYNRATTPSARLAGWQLDIEPYLLPGYHLAVERWLSAYIDTLREVRAATDMPIEIAVPFWWSGQPYRGGSLLDALAPHVDAVAVMNYRTDPARIRESAEPFLAWGARHRRSVRIALEAGPIDDEVVRHYRPAKSGELWLIELGGQPVLALLDKPAAVSTGRAYAFSHQTGAPGGAVTFRGKTRELAALATQLEAEWAAWPGFAGVALHEFEPE